MRDDQRHDPGLTADEQLLVAQMSVEMRCLLDLEVGLPLTLGPLTALQLAGLLQLCLRHPDLPDVNRAAATALLQQVTAFFEPWPALSALIARGNDPREDLAWPASTAAPRIILP